MDKAAIIRSIVGAGGGHDLYQCNSGWKPNDLKVVGKKGGAEQTIEGTYKVEKNTFTFTLKTGDQEVMQTITITKISEKEMSTKDKDGKVVELTKKK